MLPGRVDRWSTSRRCTDMRPDWGRGPKMFSNVDSRTPDPPKAHKSSPSNPVCSFFQREIIFAWMDWQIECARYQWVIFAIVGPP